MTPDSFISSQRSLPSRERSPTPQKAEKPSCSSAMLRISSWISTVLPTPAPPNRPTLPPFAYGASRSTTLIPVSSTSWVGVRSSTSGAGRWIGQRVSASTVAGVVDRLAEQVEDPAEGRVADRHGDRAAGVDHLVAALEAVGRVHRDRADAVVAEVLLDLADQRVASSASRSASPAHLDLERRVDLGQVVVAEHGVDDDAGDALHACRRSCRSARFVSVVLSHVPFLSRSDRALRLRRRLPRFPA